MATLHDLSLLIIVFLKGSFLCPTFFLLLIITFYPLLHPSLFHLFCMTFQSTESDAWRVKFEVNNIWSFLKSWLEQNTHGSFQYLRTNFLILWAGYCHITDVSKNKQLKLSVLYETGVLSFCIISWRNHITPLSE